LGVPLVAADTDEQADYLATSVLPTDFGADAWAEPGTAPAGDSMDGLWLPHEKDAV
jgi:hypothetical protein